jgi:hypothetical protein
MRSRFLCALFEKLSAFRESFLTNPWRRFVDFLRRRMSVLCSFRLPKGATSPRFIRRHSPASPRLALLGIEQLEPRELLSGGTVLANQTYLLTSDINEHFSVTATVTANDSSYQGLYLWDYHVTNIDFATVVQSDDGIASFAVNFSPNEDVTNVTTPVNWFEDGPAVWLGNPKNSAFLQAGQSADFAFTTLPRALALDTASTQDLTFNDFGGGLVLGPGVGAPPASTITSLSASNSSTNFGQPVTFTATVINLSGSTTPTGAVTFYDGDPSNGGTQLDTENLNASGVATSKAITSLSSGSHNIYAVYDGDLLNAISTSSPLSYVVNPLGTVLAQQTYSLSGQDGQINVTATVTANNPNYPGLYLWDYHVTNVDFSNNNGPPPYDGISEFGVRFSPTTDVANMTSPTNWEGSIGLPFIGDGVDWGTPEGNPTVIQPGQSGDFTFTTAPRALALDLPAAWDFDNDFSGVDMVSGSVLGPGVGAPPSSTTTDLIGSDEFPALGQLVTYTATVSSNSSGAPTPTGTVTFFDGTTELGTSTLNSGGVATFTTPTTMSGTNNISAVYNGDLVNAISTGYFNETVGKPVVILVNPGTQNSTEGNTVSLPISAVDTGGDTLTYIAQGLPPGLQINPTTGVVSGTLGAGTAAEGPYQTTVTASDGTYYNGATFTWNVSSPIALTNPGTQNSTEGNPVSLALTASDGTLTYSAQGLPTGLTINTSTGAISGTIAPGSAANGPYNVIVTAEDGTYSDSQPFTWNVSSPITLATPADQTNNEGDNVSLTLRATDSTSGTLTFAASGLPNGLFLNPTTGVISGTVAVGDAANGPYSVMVTASDNTYSTSEPFTWNVNSPITLTTPPDQTNNENDSVNLQVQANDATGGTLTYGASGLPTGLSINPTTGLISGTVAVGDAANGPYSVTLFAADNTYSQQTSFTWNVNVPVTITTPDDQSNNDGDVVSLQVSATDTNGGSLTYSATGLPTGLSINASTGLISGTITVGGTFQPTVTATDGPYSASTPFNWFVNSPISINDPGDQATNAGDTVSLQIVATDSESGALTYSATGLPSGLSINASTGLISGTIPSTLSAGIYNTTLTVGDSTDNEYLPFTWTVYPSSRVTITNPGTQNGTEGKTVLLALSASDSSGGTLEYAAVGLPAGLEINPSTGVITGTLAAGAGAFGPYAVTVTATDGTYGDSTTFIWNVSSPITLTNPGTQNSIEGKTVSLTLSASDATGGTLTYGAQGLPSGLEINPTTGAITGTIAPGSAANGPYDVTITAEDGTYSDSQSFTWNVSSPVTLTTPANQTNNEGDNVLLTLSATDSTGGTLTFGVSGLPNGLVLNPSTGVISGTVALGDPDNGPFTVTVTAEDGTYGDSQTFTWTVNNPITLTTPADQTSNEGANVSLTLSATDASGGTLTYAALGLPTGLVLNPTTGVISGTIAVGDSANGPYSVTIEAEDGTYNTEATFTWNVNNPVAITVPDDQTNNRGDNVSLQISASDASSGTLTYSATDLPNGLNIDAISGLISGTVTVGGFFQTTVTASDGTYSDTESFNWTVNSPVSITDPGDQFNSISDTVSLPISATDSASGTLNYSAAGLPDGLSINSSTGLISGTISGTASTSTPYTTTIIVSDGANIDIDIFQWSVSQAGPVVVANPGNQSNTTGDEVVVQVLAADTSGGTLYYSATGLPDGLFINPDTGLIFGTVAADAASATPYQVTVTATDGANSNTQTFAWTVNAAGAVTLGNPGDQTTSEGGSVSLSLSGSDSSGGTVYYAAFGLPPGLKINPNTGVISGTIAPEDAVNGPYTVTVEDNDGAASDWQTFAWNINGPISITPPADQTNNEGDNVSLAISATDTGGGTLTYTAEGLPPGLQINPTTGVISGTVAVGDAADGPYTVVVVAEDIASSASTTISWNINNPITITTPADQTNNEGNSVTVAVSASDASGGTLHYSAEGLPPGLQINPSTGVITGIIATGASGIGSYSPTITASDGTYSNNMTFNWSVNSAITVTDLGDQVNSVGDNVHLTVQASDANSGATMRYAATGLPTGLQINPSTGIISGTIGASAAAIGTYTTIITVSDGNSTAFDPITWTVSPADVVSLSAPSSESSVEGNTVSVPLSATDSSGGTVKYFASDLPGGLSLNPNTGIISGVIAAGDAAGEPYSVLVTATDGTNSISEIVQWNVASLVTLAPISDQTNTEGDPVNLPISAGDSSGGTLVYSAAGLPPGLKINSSTGTITGTVALDASAVGSYSVTLTASDGPNSASQIFNWTVNSPITLTVPADQTNYEGDSVSVQIGASDSSGGSIKYLVTGLPAGLIFNPTTGLISGTVAAGASDYGPYNVTVTASDGTFSTSQTFAWTVNDPISMMDPRDQDVVAGAPVSLQLVATDAHSGGTLRYSATNLPVGAFINQTTGAIYGTVSNFVAAAGDFLSAITVTDGLFSNTVSINWSVLSAAFGLTTVAFQKSETPSDLPEKDLQQQKLIDGVPVKKVKDVSGPDVTAWFAQELFDQIAFRKKALKIVTEKGGPTEGVANLAAFYLQGKYAMSDKWMDFRSPDSGKGVNTVILAGKILRKNQLGNIEFQVIGTLLPPPFFASAEKVAAKGYDIGPTYAKRHPHSRTYKGFQDLYRADNLAAFGVGNAIAERIEQLASWKDKREVSVEQLKTIITDLFANEPAMKKAVNQYSYLLANKLGKKSVTIGIDALTTVPTDGGFNTQSLTPSKGPPYKGPTGEAYYDKTLAEEYSRYKRWYLETQGKFPYDMDPWLQFYYEDLTHPKGGTRPWQE